MPVLYKQRDLRTDTTTSPPLAPLAGGRPAKRDRVLSAFANTDRLLGNGRRVLGRVGLHGSERMGVTSTNPVSVSQVYPTKSQERVALRVKCQPTPGSFPMISALVLPSGMTQKVGAGFVADTIMGTLKVTATFVASGTTTVSWLVPLPASGETWGGEKSDAGAAWASLSRVAIPLRTPDNIKDAATLHLWSECATVELTVAYIGGCRVVDCVLQEVPLGYCREIVSDTVYTSSMVTDASGKIVGTYPPEFPVNERNGVDPTYGSDLLAQVVDRQHYRLGPILAQWSSWNESTQPVDASEAAAASTASTTFVDMLRPSITAWSAGAPGWSLSSGGNAQQHRSSNALRETRDKNACIPVRIWLLCWRTGSNNATIRLMSEDYSVAELTVSSSTEGWKTCTGHLRCGLGAEDSSVLTLLGKIGGGTDTLYVRHMVVEHVDL